MSGSELNSQRLSLLVDIENEIREIQEDLNRQMANYERFTFYDEYRDDYAAEVSAKAAKIVAKLAKQKAKIKALFD